MPVLSYILQNGEVEQEIEKKQRNQVKWKVALFKTKGP